jgi:high-affinity iron transporter
MGNALFIVWRESIEAVLVIGILYAYLMRSSETRRGLRYLWGGILAGLGLSAAVALFTLRIQSELQGQALQYFETGMLLVAAALMTQMVLWMSKHGRLLKRSLEAGMDKALDSGRLLGVALIALLAIAREGSETVLYLYGIGLENGTSPSGIYGASALGFVLALFTAWAVSKGVRFMSYRTFFKLTSVVLLFSAASLLVGATNRLIGMGLLPALMEGVWNTSAVLDSGSRIGGIVSALTGYQSRPSLMVLLVYAAFWLVTLSWSRRLQLPAPQRQTDTQVNASA